MPWQGRDIGQFQQGHGGHFAFVDQSLEDSRREIGEPQLSADMAFGQETELPQALKWQVARADEDYDAALVEARRITVDTTRIASESFPMAVPPEEAERRSGC